MYKLHNIDKSNTVTIQDQFYTCTCPGDRTLKVCTILGMYNSSNIEMCTFR